MPLLYSKYPAGTSAKLIEHSIQLEHGFTYYDYGSAKNLKIYGKTKLPEYNLTQTKAPVKIYWSQGDPLGADAEDIRKMAIELPNIAGVYKVPDPEFSHLDFLTNKYAKELVYDNVMTFLKTYQ